MRKKETPQFIKDILRNVKNGIPPQDPVMYEQRFDYKQDISSNVVTVCLVLDSITTPLELHLNKSLFNQVGEDLLKYFKTIKSPIRLKNQFKVLLATLKMVECDDVYTLSSIRSILQTDYHTTLCNDTIIKHLSALYHEGWVNIRLGYRMGKYGRFTVLEHIDVHDIFNIWD